MTETSQDMPSAPASWHAFVNSISFERWLLAWLSILLCHMFIYAVVYHLPRIVSSGAVYEAYLQGFALPVLSSTGLFVLSILARRHHQGLLGWLEAMLAFHCSFALILLLLSQARYFNIPWGQLLGLMNEIKKFASNRDIMPEIYAVSHAMANTILVAYGLGLLSTIALSQARKPLLALSQSLSLVGLLLALLLTMNNSLSGDIRLSQPGAPDVEFAWQTQINNCVDYRFAAAGVRAIWLGDEGLVSVDPINYGVYCDDVPRLLRVITSDEQEQRYLVGKVGWVNLDAWWLAVALALLLPLIFLYTETWLRQFQVNAVDETHLAAQESR